VALPTGFLVLAVKCVHSFTFTLLSEQGVQEAISQDKTQEGFKTSCKEVLAMAYKNCKLAVVAWWAGWF
jgi:hypothetical protein